MSDTFRIENGAAFIGHRPIVTAKVLSIDIETYRKRQIKCLFDNGYELSIIFGSETYSDNQNHYGPSADNFTETPRTAEIAVIHPTKGLIDFDNWGDTVLGRQTPDEVWAIYQQVEALPGVEVMTDPETGEPCGHRGQTCGCEVLD